MLCLSRNREERITLYQDDPDGGTRKLGEIVVMSASHDCARLGFDMRGDINVVRNEVDMAPEHERS